MASAEDCDKLTQGTIAGKPWSDPTNMEELGKFQKAFERTKRQLNRVSAAAKPARAQSAMERRTGDVLVTWQLPGSQKLKQNNTTLNATNQLDPRLSRPVSAMSTGSRFDDSITLDSAMFATYDARKARRSFKNGSANAAESQTGLSLSSYKLNWSTVRMPQINQHFDDAANESASQPCL